MPHLPEPALPGGLSRLSGAAGVHHAVHAGAERPDRAFLSQLEGRMRLAAPVPDFRGGTPGHRRVDPLVQRGAPAPGAGLLESARTPGATRSTSGLISG